MYDFVFITHLPAFYKVNLYNELAKRLKLHVIFIGTYSEIRSKDFTDINYGFDHTFLYGGNFEKRPKFIDVLKMIRLLNKLKYKKLVIGGWDLVEFWTALIISKKEKNCLALESTIYESPAIGIKSLFKKIFVSRVSIAFVSGAPHKKLMAALGFKGICKVTKGVGLINKPQISFVGKPFEGKFLCVARLSAEKNLEMLIEAFNGLPFSLTIIGDGPLELGLKKLAKDNISFIPHVPNKQIGNYYLSHDALILPSLRETWGLVVEEALYYGLPAIVSNRVGSCDELIKNGINGMIFDPSAINGLRQSILYLSEEDNYEKIRGNVLRDGLAKKDQDQINSYLETV